MTDTEYVKILTNIIGLLDAYSIKGLSNKEYFELVDLVADVENSHPETKGIVRHTFTSIEDTDMDDVVVVMTLLLGSTWTFNDNIITNGHSKFELKDVTIFGFLKEIYQIKINIILCQQFVWYATK